MKHPYHYLVFFLLATFFGKVSAQSVSFKKDTVYIVYCYGTLENGRPVVNSVAIRNLDFLKDLSIIKDENDFLCAFFKHSIIYRGELISIHDHKAQYNYQNKKEERLAQIKLEQQIALLNKAFKDFTTQRFSNKKALIFSIAKLSGEFWMDKINPDYISGESETFTIDKECYNYNYRYYLKQVDKVLELSKGDLEQINLLLSLQKKNNFVQFVNDNEVGMKLDAVIIKDQPFKLEIPNSLRQHTNSISTSFLHVLDFTDNQKIILLYLPNTPASSDINALDINYSNFTSLCTKEGILNELEAVRIDRHRHFGFIKTGNKGFYAIYLNVRSKAVTDFNHSISSVRF